MENYQFIIDTTVNFFKNDQKGNPVNETLIKNFLEDSDQKLLSTYIDDDDNSIKFDYKIPDNYETVLLFYKSSHQRENGDLKLGMTTIEGGIIRTIYSSITSLLYETELARNDYSQELINNIENLRSQMSASLGIAETGILSIKDEIQYWTQKSSNSIAKSDKETARILVRHFEGLNAMVNEFKKLKSSQKLRALDDLMDKIQYAIDEIWRLENVKYPQNRMTSLLDFFSSLLVACCVDELNQKDDIWSLNMSTMNEITDDVKDVLSSWSTICDSLTRLFWTNCELHLWVGQPFTSIRVQTFTGRLDEVVDIWMRIYQEANLNYEDYSSVKKDENDFSFFFRNIDIYDTTPIGEKYWRAAKNKFEDAMSAIDQKIAMNIKMAVHSSAGNNDGIIDIFSQYENIFKSQSIRHALKIECSLLFQAIKNSIGKLEKSLNLWKQKPTQPDEDISSFVTLIRYLKVAEHQMKKLDRVTKTILVDEDNYDELRKVIANILKDYNDEMNQNFKDWCEHYHALVSSGELIIRENESVVKFESSDNQHMTATYNFKLIVFCNDIETLKKFGFTNIPFELAKFATMGKRYLSYAKNLQQIANFHNTIGDKIIPCHRPIMLKSAVEFSNLVKSESVSWNNSESVERYIEVLQSAINKLSKDLNLLTANHEVFKSSILKLMSTDILKQSSVWRDEMKNLRSNLMDLERKGYTNLHLYKVHWDYQLYKALEYQLVSLLIDTREKLPDIHVEIVFRQQQLQFRPTMEEIRNEYYAQIKKYIEMPLSFHGFSDRCKEIFAIMIQRNRSKFNLLYEKAEQVFARLNEFRNLWLPWVAIGCINLENLCKVHLTSWEHWDRNFKSCKNFSQKIAKIQKSEEKIDCFVVNVGPIRSQIEFLARNYWETLSFTLRSSILEDGSFLQEYISSSLQVLQHIPTDETELISTSYKYDKIIGDLPKMTELYGAISKKNNCLMGWCKESVESIDSLINQWEKLLPLIDNHQTLIQGQIEVLKDNLGSKIKSFDDEIEKFLIKFEDTLKDLEGDPNSNIDNFLKRKEDWNAFLEKKQTLLDECEKFNATPLIEKVQENFLTVHERVVKLEKDWVLYVEFCNQMKNVEDTEWSVLRRKSSLFAEFLAEWETKTANQNAQPALRIRKHIEHYRQILPMLNILQTESMNDKHWAHIFQLINLKPKPYLDLTLHDVLQNSAKLQAKSEEIKTIAHQAHSEQIVRQAVNELEQWADLTNFKLFPYVDSTKKTIHLIRDFADLLNKIGDNQCLLNTSKNTTVVENFVDQIEMWESKLNLLNFILTSLSSIQKKWIYLEPIFSSGSFKSGESIFKRIDKDFRYIIQNVNTNQKVVSLVKINNIQKIVESIMSQLSQCQNSLSKYMSEKRESFPRFYFLTNDDLLEIFGQSQNMEVMQKHINKLFPGVNKLIFSDDNKEKLSIVSLKSTGSSDEVMKLTKEVTMEDSIEEFLQKFDAEIKMTLKLLIQQCVQESDFLTISTIEKYPMQVLCLVKSFHFTSEAEKAISTMSLQTLLRNKKDDVNILSTLLRDCSSRDSESKIRALLIDFVYQVTTVEYLIMHNVTDLNDWHWLQQIKFFYNTRNQSISIKMVRAEFEYSYEFLGHYNKLVYTALTHNCYLTLTQAMVLGLGGNPLGRAGTGKTECVKSLGAMMGRMVLVFNCNENIDTSAMALILTGISRCGAWACFDEFNRLQEDTLSAIAMLIQPLQNALKDKKSDVQLLDKKVQLNHHSSVFVTLNPVNEDYGGRNHLPLNLQSLFRPIVMKQPEPVEIAKVILFIEGFEQENAEEIGKRIVELFDLASKLLSKQRFYDWGLRELKTLLVACGKSLRDFKTANPAVDHSMDVSIRLVVQSIKCNVVSKLTKADRRLFQMLLSNVFPEPASIVESNETFKTKLHESMAILGLSHNSRQVEKCTEIYEQLTKRTGVCLFGPTSSGKSTCLNILKSALTSMSQTIRTYVISPKSMSRSKLLGYLDLDTRQWHDGVLTQTTVAVNSEASNVISWIICDGDIDPEWIEALNSVLDDNKLLTLPSGWRIQLGDNVNFIFETHDLSHASPATISRMGIINFSSEDLTCDTLVSSWITSKQDEEFSKSAFKNYFDHILSAYGRFSKFSQQVNETSLTKNILSCLPDNMTSDEEVLIELVKAFNLSLHPSERNKFTNEILDYFNIYNANVNCAEFIYFNKFRNQSEVYSTEQTFTELNFDSKSQDIPLVQTATVKTVSDTLRTLLKRENHQAFTIVGNQGIGKTLMINSVVSEMIGYQLKVVNCNSQLNNQYIMNVLKSECLVISGFKGKEYKPRKSRLVLMMKNIDLCPVDSWGTSDVIELLMQLISRHGFYDNNLEWTSVEGLQICATLSDIQQHRISSRFLMKNVLIQISEPSQHDMQHIIGNFVHNSVKLTSQITENKLAEMMLNCYNDVVYSFSSEKSSHYQFSPKMIEMWIEGLSNYSKEDFTLGLMYEFARTFGDRLNNDDDMQIFHDIIKRRLKTPNVEFDENSTFFVNSAEKQTSLILYSHEQWLGMVEKHIHNCISEIALIDSPITNESLLNVAAILHCLITPGSHICLAGKLGIGKFDAVAVCSSILEMKMMFPNLTENYTLDEFHNDLKQVLQACGLEDKRTIFYIDHLSINHLPDILKACEAIIENEISNYNIFGDELDSIANALKNTAQLEGYQDNITSFFLNRVKKNLHLVISLDTNFGNFKDMIKDFRCLYKKANFIWFKDFPFKTKIEIHEKVIATARNGFFASNISQEAVLSLKDFKPLLDICEQSMDSPQRLVQLVKSYLLIYGESEKLKTGQMSKLESGIEKLSSAYKYVAKLKAEAEEKESALAEKRQMAEQALKMISHTIKSANEQKSDMVKLKSETEEKSEVLKQRKLEIEQELSLVEPLLKEASVAVGSIKSEALSEIRSLRAPPETIRDILEGVLRLMGIKDTSWNSMKSFLAKRGVKEDIRSLNPSLVSEENCAEVEKLILARPDSFDFRNAKRASAVAGPLANWVIACVKYCQVVHSIKPLEREQRDLEKNLEKAENHMKSLSTEIDDVNAKVKELTDQLNLYTQEAAVLEIELEDTRKTLKSTEILVEKLSTEYNSWREDLNNIKKNMLNIHHETAMISLCINYFSHMLEDDRLVMIRRYCGENKTNFKMNGSLYTDQDILIWESLGLLPDKQSSENASIVMKLLSLPFGVAPIPLLLDPTRNALQWLTGLLKLKNEHKFDILSPSEDRFTYNVELGIRFGKILIIKDVKEPFKASLVSLLKMKIHCRFGKRFIHIGNKMVDFHEDFRLVLITDRVMKNSRGHLSNNLTLIPFTLTEKSLTDQLLVKWIAMKDPESAKKRVELLQKEGELTQERSLLQEKLLVELSHAEGDILRNEKLLRTLNEIKQKTSNIEKALIESTEIRNKIGDNYAQFKSVCLESSKFYIRISKMYRIDYKSFTEIFLNVFGQSNGDKNNSNSFKDLVKKTFFLLSRSTKETERTQLILNVIHCAYPDLITNSEWELFIYNFTDSESSSSVEVPRWVKKELQPKLISLRLQCPDLYNSLNLENEREWTNFISSADASPEKIPNSNRITDFQRLLVYQLFKPENLLPMIDRVSPGVLGINDDSFQNQNSRIKQLLSEEDEKHEPILIIAPGGTDPCDEIEQYAKSAQWKYREIYIGDDQSDNIALVLAEFAKNGGILCFQNVHLKIQIIEKNEIVLRSTNLHENFRIIYICENDENLTKLATVKYRKLVLEPPKGIKFKIINLLDANQDLFKNNSASKIFVSLFILHSIIVEYRNFIPQGWSKWYDFCDADIKAAVDFFKSMKIASVNSINWELLRGFVEKIVYGGRVDNDQDLKKIILLIRDYFDEKVMNMKWSPRFLNIEIPNMTRLEDYQGAFMKIGTKHEHLGLSQTSIITKNMISCRNLLKNLRKQHVNIDDTSTLEKRIKPLAVMWKKLIQNFKRVDIEEFMSETCNICEEFKLSEAQIANEITHVITSTLAKLRSVDKNSLTAAEEKMLLTLSDNSVPYEWRKVWNGPRIATDYLKAVSIRAMNAIQLLNRAQEPIGEIDFSSIFNVDSFLSMLKILTSRSVGVPPNDLVLDSECDESVYERMKAQHTYIVKVQPLIIDGLQMENQQLVKSSTGVNSTSTFYLFYREMKASELSVARDHHPIPVYSTFAREELLCTINLKSMLSQHEIVYSGTALVVNAN